jgi:hypothetical protein
MRDDSALALDVAALEFPPLKWRATFNRRCAAEPRTVNRKPQTVNQARPVDI